jgi:hypothetical protein
MNSISRKLDQIVYRATTAAMNATTAENDAPIEVADDCAAGLFGSTYGANGLFPVDETSSSVGSTPADSDSELNEDSPVDDSVLDAICKKIEAVDDDSACCAPVDDSLAFKPSTIGTTVELIGEVVLNDVELNEVESRDVEFNEVELSNVELDKSVVLSEDEFMKVELIDVELLNDVALIGADEFETPVDDEFELVALMMF